MPTVTDIKRLKPWRAPAWRIERFLITSDRTRCDSNEPTTWQKAFDLTPWMQCEKMTPDFALWIALLRLATVASCPTIKPGLIQSAEAELDDES
jgi:hypothetical protein